MLKQLLISFCVMGVCVVMHAAATAWALRRLRRTPLTALQFGSVCWLFIRLAAWLVLLHLGEIGVWAQSYLRGDAMPDVTSALYFSAVTYTTTGYGDLVLPADWRLVGAVEALTGILMCGWSTAFFFAVVSELAGTHTGRHPSGAE